MKSLSLLLKSYINNYCGLPHSSWTRVLFTSLQAIVTGLSFFLSLYFVSDLKINMSIVGILMSCYGVGTVLGGILGGKLSDNYSLRIVTATAILIQGLTFAALGIFTNLLMLSVIMFLMGSASFTFMVANDVWLLSDYVDVTSSIRLKAVNLSRVAMNFGFGLSGILIAVFSTYSYELLFILFSSLLLISGLVILYQKNPSLIDEVKIESEIEQSNVSAHTENSSLLFYMLCSVFLVGLMIAQLSTTYPIFVKAAFPSMGIQAVSDLFILDTIIIVLFQAPIANALSGYNKVMIAGIGAALMGGGIAILTFSFSFYFAIISCVIWTLGEILFIPAAQLVCYENGENNKKGRMLGMYQSTYAVSKIVGPILGGIVYQYAGGDILWYSCAVMGLFCLLSSSRLVLKN